MAGGLAASAGGAGGQFLGDRFSLSGEDLAGGLAILGSSALPSILFPAIADRMRCHHSLVVTDLSVLVQYYVQWFATVTGHLVLTHRTDSPFGSCAINPCRGIEGTDEAGALAGILLSRAHGSAIAGNRQGMRSCTIPAWCRPGKPNTTCANSWVI